jgi:hypothetical protein
MGFLVNAVRFLGFIGLVLIVFGLADIQRGNSVFNSAPLTTGSFLFLASMIFVAVRQLR